MQLYEVLIGGSIREIKKSIGSERSSDQSKVRKGFIAKNNKCAACGKKTGLHVHHIQPFQLRPDLELEEFNLITLCADHHFHMAHLMDQKSQNNDIVKDSSYFLNKIKLRPYKNK